MRLSQTSRRETAEFLARWLLVAVVVELVLLRTGTRTLIHIPGLGRFDVSIGALAEVGRFAYYMAVVLVISALIYVALALWPGGRSSRALSALVVLFIFAAAAGRLGALSGVGVLFCVDGCERLADNRLPCFAVYPGIQLHTYLSLPAPAF